MLLDAMRSGEKTRTWLHLSKKPGESSMGRPWLAKLRCRSELQEQGALIAAPASRRPMEEPEAMARLAMRSRRHRLFPEVHV